MQQAAGKSQRQLAKESGISYSVISRWARGETAPWHEDRTWAVIASMAKGTPAEGEDRPVFVVTFASIGGQVAIADETDKLLVFADPRNATAVYDHLVGLGMPQAAILPLWKRELRNLAPTAERNYIDRDAERLGFDTRQQALAAVDATLDRMARELAPQIASMRSELGGEQK
jgi:transcriptional regulator with XRE-family HTH domain